MTERPAAPAVARNRDAILEVLLTELANCGRVLEIGSGTGEHAVFFARRLSWLTWRTSDRRVNHPGIRAWLAHEALSNVEPPLVLDVSDPPDIERNFDAVFSANTAHIMSEAEVERMFALVGRVLREEGRFCLYGPFNRDGQFTSDSNASFDASLRAQDSRMGIRDLERLDGFALDAGLQRSALYAMPANNFIAVWVRSAR